MRYLGLGVVLDAGDSYRQTVLTGLEGALSRYMQPVQLFFSTFFGYKFRG